MKGKRVGFGRTLIKHYNRPTFGSPVLGVADRSFLSMLAVVMTPVYPSGGRRIQIDL